MADWFRNKSWFDEIAGEFEKWLARAADPEQYLKIQGYELLAHDPAAGAALLERCAELDGYWRPAALLYLAQARLMLQDVEGAIEALDGALADEGRSDRVGTGARTDLALVVACYRIEDRYEEALRYLAEANGRDGPHLAEELAAEALIRAEIGDTEAARPKAAEALDLFGPLADGAFETAAPGRPMPPVKFSELIGRLRAIAADGTQPRR